MNSKNFAILIIATIGLAFFMPTVTAVLGAEQKVTASDELINYYRSLGNNPLVVEESDLQRAINDWNIDKIVDKFTEPINTVQLLKLINEWNKNEADNTNIEPLGAEIVITEKGSIYTFQKYEASFGNNVTQKTSFLLGKKCCAPIENLIIAYPPDNMDGQYSYIGGLDEKFFNQSVAYKVLNGDMGNMYAFNDWPQENTAILVIDKVRASYIQDKNDSDINKINIDVYANDLETIMDFVLKEIKPKKVFAVGQSRGVAVLGELTKRISVGEYSPEGSEYLGMSAMDLSLLYRSGLEEYNNSEIMLKAIEEYKANGNSVFDNSGLFGLLYLAQSDPDNFSAVLGYEAYTNIQTLFLLMKYMDQTPGTIDANLSDNWNMRSLSIPNDEMTSLKYIKLEYLFYVLNKGGFYPYIPIGIEQQTLEIRTGEKNINIENWHKKRIQLVQVVSEDGSGKYPDAAKYTAEQAGSATPLILPGGHLDNMGLP